MGVQLAELLVCNTLPSRKHLTNDDEQRHTRIGIGLELLTTWYFEKHLWYSDSTEEADRVY